MVATPEGFSATSARCRGCVAYHDCQSRAKNPASSNAARGIISKLRLAMKPATPFFSMAAALGVTGAGAMLLGTYALTSPPHDSVGNFAQREVGDGVSVRVRSESSGRFSSNPLASGLRNLLFPPKSDYTAVQGTVVVNADVERKIEDLLSLVTDPASTKEQVAIAALELDRHRGALQHEAGHVRHHDAERQTAVFALGTFSAYTVGNLTGAPFVRRTCARTAALGGGSMGTFAFHAAHAALVLSSAAVGMGLSRRYARALEQHADDSVSTQPAIGGLLRTLEEEDGRARAWMEDNGITSQRDRERVYLREDPNHPPLPVRIEKLKSRLVVAKGAADDTQQQM